MGNLIVRVLESYGYKTNDNINAAGTPGDLNLLISHYMFLMSEQELKKWISVSYCNTWINNISKMMSKDSSNVFIEETFTKVCSSNTNNTNITQMCNDIAKFYVKVVHIYAVIFFSLNPVFAQKTQDGTYVALDTATELSSNIPVSILKFDACRSKIVKKVPAANTNNGFIMGGGGPAVTGCGGNIIPEIASLYYDNYNLDTGSFDSMSPSSKQTYRDDLRMFYNVLNSNKHDNVLPRRIHQFQDILKTDIVAVDSDDNDDDSNIVLSDGAQLRTSGGGREKTRLNKAFGTLSGQLLVQYAASLKKLVRETKHAQTSVLSIFAKMFVFTDENESVATIHPDLQSSDLETIVKDARKTIVRLFLNCEMNFTKNIQIYESIVEHKILNTTQQQIKQLELIRDELVTI